MYPHPPTTPQSDEGNQLQHQAASETDNLVPSHRYVPWVVANGQHDSAIEEAIETDLVRWACDNYKGSATARACSALITE